MPGLFRVKIMHAESKAIVEKKMKQAAEQAESWINAGEKFLEHISSFSDSPTARYALLAEAAEHYQNSLNYLPRKDQGRIRIKLLQIYKDILLLAKQLSLPGLSQITTNCRDQMKHQLAYFPPSSLSPETQAKRMRDPDDLPGLAERYFYHACYQYFVGSHHAACGKKYQAAFAFQVGQRYYQHQQALIRHYHRANEKSDAQKIIFYFDPDMQKILSTMKGRAVEPADRIKHIPHSPKPFR